MNINDVLLESAHDPIRKANVIIETDNPIDEGDVTICFPDLEITLSVGFCEDGVIVATVRDPNTDGPVSLNIFPPHARPLEPES